jgi:AraC-like DNA-binding protein
MEILKNKHDLINLNLILNFLRLMIICNIINFIIGLFFFEKSDINHSLIFFNFIITMIVLFLFYRFKVLGFQEFNSNRSIYVGLLIFYQSLIIFTYVLYGFNLIILYVFINLFGLFWCFSFNKIKFIITFYIIVFLIAFYLKKYFNIQNGLTVFEHNATNFLIIVYSFFFMFYLTKTIFEIKNIEVLLKSNRDIAIVSNTSLSIKDKKADIGENNLEIASRDLFNEIEVLMINKKVWLNPEYNLTKLAREVGSNVTYVSQAINKFAKVNHRSYINEFRLNAFIGNIHHIKSGKYTIKDVFYSSGFNSQATFNRVFKAQFKITPQEYIDTVQNDVEL